MKLPVVAFAAWHQTVGAVRKSAVLPLVMFVHLRVVQPAFRPWTLASVYSLSQKPPAVRLEKICVCVCMRMYICTHIYIYV